MSNSPTSSTHSAHTPIDATRSVASSPTTTMTSAHSGPDADTFNDNDNRNNENSLDDIFGSSPESDNHFVAVTRTAQEDAARTEPSDLPALRRQHVTAGYRDGIAASKAEHVQEGFDGGYPVGTQFGLRVGAILGILEGVIKGLQGRDSAGPVKKRAIPRKKETTAAAAENAETEEEKTARNEKIERVKRLYTAATKELDVEALFGGLTADEDQDDTERQNPETRMKAKAEPVLAKWERLVGVTAWEESMEAVESMEDADEKTG